MSRFSSDQMCGLADEAIASIDKRGRRGTERVTYDQIEAMACLIIALRAELDRDCETHADDPSPYDHIGSKEESTDD